MAGERYRAAYRRGFTGVDGVLLRRYSGTGDARTSAEGPVRARIVGAGSSELVGAIAQDGNSAVVLAEDVEALGWTPALKRGDKLVFSGREYNIEAVDDRTRRAEDTLLAYVVELKG